MKVSVPRPHSSKSKATSTGGAPLTAPPVLADSSAAASSSGKKTKSKSKDSNEVEKQFVLRVTEDVAQQIREMMKQNDKGDKESKKGKQLEMEIKFDEDEYYFSEFADDIPGQEPDELADPVEQLQQLQLHQQMQQRQTEAAAEGGSIGSSSDPAILPDQKLPRKTTARTGIFRIGDKYYTFDLVDLPCIVEAYKSIDCMTYYKSGDISQMFVVNGNQVQPNFKEPKKPKFTTSQFKFPSGLTRPTRNIRKFWDRQVLNVTKKDIQMMVDEFKKMMEEDSSEVIEIISEDEYDEMDEVGSNVSSPTTSVTGPDVSPRSNVTTSPAPSSDRSPPSGISTPQPNKQHLPPRFVQNPLLSNPLARPLAGFQTTLHTGFTNSPATPLNQMPQTPSTAKTTPITSPMSAISNASNSKSNDDMMDEDYDDEEEAIIKSQDRNADAEERTSNVSLSEDSISVASNDDNVSLSSGAAGGEGEEANGLEEELSDISADDKSFTEEEISAEELQEITAQRAALDSEIKSLEFQIEQKKKELSRAPNPMIRQRLNANVTTMEGQLKEKLTAYTQVDDKWKKLNSL